MKYGILKSLFVVALACPLASSAWAGGLYLYEVGSADTGLASAGYASRAQDASTLFTNPAGMTRLETSEMDIGAQVMYLRTKFSPNENTNSVARNVPNGSTLPGDTAANGNPSGFIPAGGLFYVNKISDKFAAGFGVFGFFGLAAEYEDNWVGRYYATKVQLQGLTLMPSVAYKANDKISFGAGLNAMYGTLDTKMAVNNRAVGNLTATDGSMEIKDNEWGYGGKFGVLYEISKGTRVGLTYLTKTKLDFSATPSLNNVRTGLATILSSLTINLTVRSPQQFILSGYHELSDKLAIMGDWGWENWQDFGNIDTGVYDQSGGGVSTTINAHYKNTWHVALGAQYKLSDPWKISFGGAYDSTMVDGANRTPTLPVGAMWRFAGGAQYALSQTMTLNGGYEYIWTGNLPMDVNRGLLAGEVAGEYTNSCLQVLTVALNWKF
jgi:long-chain fatty acid transport protein